ncbi:atypical kinase COQ8B, mitochondrial [Diaphorina citri]|uniref:Atypical kinase COQ8B, mitochondrial n=1 Tax=Diaphorina citri TaxID=121845 RepID=A0A3Q0J0F1_DIACI|nr:atypical kinase COQ8B, mitochondrial [Diaphorina citri]
MSGTYVSDLKGVLKGLQLVANAGIKHQTLEIQQKWTNSSFKSLASNLDQSLKSTSTTPCALLNANVLKEAAERSSVVLDGVKAFVFKEAGSERDVSEFEQDSQYSEPVDSTPIPQVQTSTPITATTTTASQEQSKPINYTSIIDSESLERIKQIPFMKGVDPKTNLEKSKLGYKKAMELTKKKDAFAVVDEDVARAPGAPKPIPKAKNKPQLNPVAKQRKVPSSRLGRMVSFGSLAAGLGVGTIAEVTRRTLGFGDSSLSVGTTLDSAFINPANAERIVNTLCKVRGAALKIGQILSIQDSNVISPELQKAFERVRIDIARKDNRKKIERKKENIMDGEFEGMLVEPYPYYFVPTVIDELSTGQILTTELIEGVPVDQCVDLDYESRKHICKLVMELCLRELFQFRYMQTDPNWSNFFYNKDTKQLILLDFGATRAYSKEFMDQYIQVIKAGADGDKDKVLTISRKMGFLTGYESKIMEEAHVNTVMILSEVFSEKIGEFDFGGQDTTKRITELVPTILNHRLCPPPEEIYSLHRKLSGVFLLCSKLKVKMACYPMLKDVYDNYKFDTV